MDIYAKQWQSETKEFFAAVDRGNYSVFDEGIWVELKDMGNDNDPRFVIWEFGAYRLRDDHFCVQHSPQLSDTQLRTLLNVCRRHGIDVIQFYLYYEINEL